MAVLRALVHRPFRTTVVMKRFQFPLQKLLRYHQQRQKQADLALAHAGRERELAEGEVRRLEGEIQLACRLSEQVGQPIQLSLREQSLRRVELLNETLCPVKERLKTAERHFREAQMAHTAITQNVEALLHLPSRQWEEHQDEVARRQQMELDDVVMKQWARKPVATNDLES